MQLDKHNYTRELTNEGFETLTATRPDSVSTGDCLIGTSGNLYPVVELKHDLLQLGCATCMCTVTLDMCRNEVTRGSKNEGIRMADSIRKVVLR